MKGCKLDIGSLIDEYRILFGIVFTDILLINHTSSVDVVRARLRLEVTKPNISSSEIARKIGSSMVVKKIAPIAMTKTGTITSRDEKKYNDDVLNKFIKFVQDKFKTL
ncbi:hypothetical protein QYF36_025974 [Acer negundo]|nr:hypothetical protein QYF36_025974 [Acer negundo]